MQKSIKDRPSLSLHFHDHKGRPSIPAEIRRLILRMTTVNPLWRAPRIHGELKMLGIMISERTVSRILKSVRRPPPSPTWKTFLRNNLGQIVSVDFFTVPGLTFDFPQQLEIVVENPEVLVPILSQNLVRTFIPGQVHERDGITASQTPGSGPKRSVIAGKVWYAI